MQQDDNDAAWCSYYCAMRRYNAAGELQDKPRAPLQLGRHIDSMPLQHNEPGNPQRALTAVERRYDVA